MKLTSLTSCLSLLVLVTSGVGLIAQPKAGVSTKEFMREKLQHSQKILQGLSLEDFALISANSKKLSAMSQEATWEVFENPNYDEQSRNFRRAVNALTKAADAKNLDAATLAYLRVTMSCVECHKAVRGKFVAEAPSSSGRSSASR